jgi:surface protein
MLGLGLGLSKSPGPLGDPAPFITEWRTETDGETITIPIITNNTYTITTSDGQEITTSGGSTTITFPIAGTHEVSISGDIQRIQFGDTGDKLKIYDVKQWGTDTTWTSFLGAFYGCSFLNVTANDVPIIATTSFTRAFRSTNLTTFNRVNDWDVSGCTNMTDLFRNSNFNEDISNWDVSSVTIMKNLFYGSSFNQDIGNWDVSNVTDMQQMFRESPFNQNLTNWNVISVNDFDNFMFGVSLSTSNYDALLIGWAAQSVQSNITINFGNSQYTAGGAAELARISLQDNYNWTISDGGIGAYTPDVFVTEWETDLSPQTITIPLIQYSTYTITTSEGDSAINFTGTNPTVTFPTAGTHQVIINGDVKQIKFNNTGDREKILDVKQWGIDTTWTSFEDAFYGCSFLNITATDTPNIAATNMFQAFRDTDLTTFNNINNWDVSSVTSMRGIFLGTNFNQDIGNWDVSNVSNMIGMFFDTNFNQNIGNWNVSSVTTMGSMFRDSPFNQDIGNWDVSNVTVMGSMFNSSSFNQDIGNWNVSNVTDMGYMFRESPFNQNLANWDVTSVTNFLNFMAGVTLSTTNYDALLIGWAAQSVNSGLSVNFGSSQFTAGGTAEAAKNTLTTTYNWNITDGGSV